MPMQVHELHPSLIHAPLVLLPVAAVTDLLAVTAGGRVRRYALDMAGRRLWWAGVGAAAVAGLAGMAASQEVSLGDERAKDAMWLHGAGNVAILLAGAGLASWRTARRASAASAAVGLGAVAAAVYTAWLGGELVYTHGAGVKTGAGVGQTAPLVSARAPWVLLRDAARGLGWLLRRGGRLAARRQPLAPGAATMASEAGQYTASSSTSNTSVALGGMSGGAPALP